MTDLVIRGGTVVTAAGRGGRRRRHGGRVAAVEPDLGGLAAARHEVIDATGLLVLPGVVDVHTHTRGATDAEPDRFFQDSVAAAFGGTTTFLSFNNPGTGGSPAAERLADRTCRVAGCDGRRQGGRLRGQPGHHGAADDPIGSCRPVDPGVPTCKAFMVYDFRLADDRLFDAMRRWAAAAGCSRSTARIRC